MATRVFVMRVRDLKVPTVITSEDANNNAEEAVDDQIDALYDMVVAVIEEQLNPTETNFPWSKKFVISPIAGQEAVERMVVGYLYDDSDPHRFDIVHQDEQQNKHTITIFDAKKNRKHCIQYTLPPELSIVEDVDERIERLANEVGRQLKAMIDSDE